jgi:hypothetical protein
LDTACVFHKRRNFPRKHDTVTKDPKVHAEAIRLFQKIIYDRRSDGADEAIVQLKQLLPTLSHYIATEIVICLADCSEACRGQVFTLGINHTGAAESANKMIRSFAEVTSLHGNLCGPFTNARVEISGFASEGCPPVSDNSFPPRSAWTPIVTSHPETY